MTPGGKFTSLIVLLREAQIGKLLLLFIATIMLTVSLSSLVVWPRELGRLAVSTLWRHIKVGDPRACSATGSDGGIVTFDCGGSAVSAPLVDLRPVSGLSAKDATKAYRDTVDGLVAQDLAGACRIVQITFDDASMPMTGAVCPSLSVHVLRSGNADLAPMALVRALYDPQDGWKAQRMAESWAVWHDTGVQADARGVRQELRIQVQAWIATLGGFVGAVGAYLFQTNRRERAVETKVQALIKEGRRLTASFIDQRGATKDEVDKLLAELRKAMGFAIDSAKFTAFNKGVTTQMTSQAEKNVRKQNATEYWSKVEKLWRDREWTPTDV